MLTYAYHCDNCGEFEVEQSIRDDALTTCERCGGPVKRLISGGSGFTMKKARPASACPPSACGNQECCSGCHLAH